VADQRADLGVGRRPVIAGAGWVIGDDPLGRAAGAIADQARLTRMILAPSALARLIQNGFAHAEGLVRTGSGLKPVVRPSADRAGGASAADSTVTRPARPVLASLRGQPTAT
jgi:hypothetical protein